MLSETVDLKVTHCMTPLYSATQWQNHRDREQINGCQRLGMGAGRGETRLYRGSGVEAFVVMEQWWWSHTSTQVIQLHTVTHTYPHTSECMETGETWTKSVVGTNVHFQVLTLFHSYIKIFTMKENWLMEFYDTPRLLLQLSVNIGYFKIEM